MRALWEHQCPIREFAVPLWAELAKLKGDFSEQGHSHRLWLLVTADASETCCSEAYFLLWETTALKETHLNEEDFTSDYKCTKSSQISTLYLLLVIYRTDNTNTHTMKYCFKQWKWPCDFSIKAHTYLPMKYHILIFGGSTTILFSAFKSFIILFFVK